MSNDFGTTKSKPQFTQLAPFFVFVALFFTLHLRYYMLDVSAKSGFALFSCVVAVFFSLFTFPKKIGFNKKIETFVQGTAQPTILYMIFIFIISSVFSYTLDQNGAVDSAVKLGLSLIPPAALLPGLFICVSLFALTIGSSMGSIAAFMPIALGFASKLGVSPSMITGLVIGGAILGDNLSVISDTTIAAVQTTGCSMAAKFKENAYMVVPAALLTLGLLTLQGMYYSATITEPLTTSISIIDLVNVVPYLLVLSLALVGIDVLAVLSIGTLLAASIGIALGSYSFVQATSFLFQGFYSQPGMINVLMLVLLIAGLAHIIENNGGIEYILHLWDNKIKSAKHAQFAIAALVFLVNAAIVINTIAILITGPVARTIGNKFGVKPERVACILDVFACACQGLAPYAPQFLLASAMAGVSSISVMPYLYYQFIITGVSLVVLSRSGR